MLTYDSIEYMFEVVIDVTTLFTNEIYINKENLTEKRKILEVDFRFLVCYFKAYAQLHVNNKSVIQIYVYYKRVAFHYSH